MMKEDLQEEEEEEIIDQQKLYLNLKTISICFI